MYQSFAQNYKVRVVDSAEPQIQEDRLKALATDEVIRLTAVNLQEREAVISRGLEGLVAFHSGGIDQADLARIIGLAQTIGIFIIAGD